MLITFSLINFIDLIHRMFILLATKKKNIEAFEIFITKNIRTEQVLYIEHVEQVFMNRML